MTLSVAPQAGFLELFVHTLVKRLLNWVVEENSFMKKLTTLLASKFLSARVITLKKISHGVAFCIDQKRHFIGPRKS